MDGRTRRTQRITERIKETALRLFSTVGIEAVSMDQIAAEADVSKVTIYKYFHSKEDLHRAVVNLYADQVIAATEALVNNPDMDFMEKLKLTLTAKTSTMAMGSTHYFIDLLKQDQQIEGRLEQQIKGIIFKFFEEGKRQGYIDPDLPFEVLYLHSQIYSAGFEAMFTTAEAALTDPRTVDQLQNLYFWGVIRKK